MHERYHQRRSLPNSALGGNPWWARQQPAIVRGPEVHHRLYPVAVPSRSRPSRPPTSLARRVSELGCSVGTRVLDPTGVTKRQRVPHQRLRNRSPRASRKAQASRCARTIPSCWWRDRRVIGRGRAVPVSTMGNSARCDPRSASGPHRTADHHSTRPEAEVRANPTSPIRPCVPQFSQGK
jgi:hypothetical protein